MSASPPIRRSILAAVATIALLAVVAGCGEPSGSPSVEGLLVATGGPLRVTDGSGALVAVEGPADPVVAVGASGGRVVAALAGGSVVSSLDTGGTRTWQPVETPGDPGPGLTLMALGPHGKQLALAVGEPQGTTFELIVLDVGVGTSRSIDVERGLNGPPTWIGQGSIAIDVIRADGTSAIAAVDLATEAVTDDAYPGQSISASLDGTWIALDDPATGEVIVGEAGAPGGGPSTQVSHLQGPAGSGVESLAISPDGERLAIVRRTDAGSASIELYLHPESGWTSGGTLALSGDGAVSVAWVR